MKMKMSEWQQRRLSVLLVISRTTSSAHSSCADALQRQLGPRAIDETLPSLLQALGQSGTVADAALAALREM